MDHLEAEKIKNLTQIQEEFAHSGISKNIAFRKKQLLLLKQLLKDNEAKLFQAIYDDIGKSSFETYLTELATVYHEIDYALKNLKKWSKPKKVKTGISNFPAKSFIMPEPLGTTLIIGAWNYPYQLVLAPAVAAIAAGNTALIKPSELPSNTAKVLEEIINKNFDPAFLHVVNGGVETTTQLLTHPYGKICFTGSTKVGQIVAKAAAETLTPTLLELGGKSPCFVLPDVDLETSAKRIAWGKFLNAGQTCIAPDYLYVHKDIYPEFLKELKRQTLLITGIKENEAKLSESYTRIINDRNLERLQSVMDSDKVYLEGGIDKEERLIGPTILRDVSWEDQCMQEEIFGPILPVIPFGDINKAISEVKKRPKPLALYAFTGSKEMQDLLLDKISFGGGCINETVMHFTNNQMPFGGVGASGMGSYHGEYGFKAFSHYKSILKKSVWFEPNIKYAPYTGVKLKILKFFFG